MEKWVAHASHHSPALGRSNQNHLRFGNGREAFLRKREVGVGYRESSQQAHLWGACA